MFIEMRVSGLTLDPITNTPIVILKDLEEKKAIPICIGIFEASALATEIEKITFSRPMTHDLLTEIVKVLKTEVTRVEIHDLRNNTFFANIHLLREGNRIIVDARPSDAIAVALRVGAPIYVDGRIVGHVTSSFASPGLGRAVMLGWQKHAPFADTVTIDGRHAHVTETPFYDPQGTRARA